MEGQLKFATTGQGVKERSYTSYKSLYRLGGMAALISLVFFPIQIAIFFTNPYPSNVADWFALLNNHPLVGLIELDLLLVIDEILVILIFLALYYALKELDPSIMTISAVTGIVSAVLFITANPAFGMLDLSAQYAQAAGEVQRNGLIAAGQGLMATWVGSGFEAAYIVGSIAPIIISVVMLRSKLFRKTTAYFGILSNVVALGKYIPTIGIYISLFSVVILWVWYLFIGLDFFKIGQSTSRGAE